MAINFVNKSIRKINDVLDKVQTQVCFSAKIPLQYPDYRVGCGLGQVS